MGSKDEGAPAQAARDRPERSQDAIAGWREVVLGRSLYAVFVVLAVGILATELLGDATTRRMGLEVLGPAILTVAGAMLWRRGPAWLRAVGLFGGMLLGIFGSGYLRAFLVPNAFAGGILVCVLAALLLGRRGALVVLGALVVGWIAIAMAFVGAGDGRAPVDLDFAAPHTWSRILVLYFTVAGVTVAAVLYMVTRLERALVRGEALYDGLVEESTDRIRALEAQRELEGRLQQSQKVELLGRLAGGVAHDFNNLLVVMMGNAELCTLPDADEAERLGASHEIMEAGARAAALTRQLLAFSRGDAREAVPIDVERGVETTLSMLRRLLPQSVSLRTELCDALPQVVGPPVAVEQILMNLCVNARDAMPDGGILSVQTAVVEHAQHAGRFVRLRVSDTGSGMDQQTMDHLFEAFFTTKPVGVGTGLGLSMVKELADRCGGFIELRSAPGEGATFDVHLAVNDAPARAVSVAPRAAADVRGGGTVLVVDDDEGALRTIVQVLRRAGYRALEARDGEAGVEVFREHADDIALVVCEAVLPRRSGQALCDRVTAMRPEQAILVCSGHTEEEFTEGFRGHPRHAFLPKPFKPDELLDAVASMLTGPV